MSTATLLASTVVCSATFRNLLSAFNGVLVAKRIPLVDNVTHLFRVCVFASWLPLNDAASFAGGP